MTARRSPNFDARLDGQAVDMLVFHYTGMSSRDDALDRLCNPAAKVSAHYVIDENGAVTALVNETKRAWHAGVAGWRGVRDVNGASIGVELVNPGHEYGYRPFPEAQMAACEALALDILSRWPIPPRNVVGHSDVATGRKTDPGELFDWARLAAAGIGLWPSRPSSASSAYASFPATAVAPYAICRARWPITATGSTSTASMASRRRTSWRRSNVISARAGSTASPTRKRASWSLVCWRRSLDASARLGHL